MDIVFGVLAIIFICSLIYYFWVALFTFVPVLACILLVACLLGWLGNAHFGDD